MLCYWRLYLSAVTGHCDSERKVGTDINHAFKMLKIKVTEIVRKFGAEAKVDYRYSSSYLLWLCKGFIKYYDVTFSNLGGT